MPRRSQSPLEMLVFLPWWVSAGLGVLLFFVTKGLLTSFAVSPLLRGIALGGQALPALVLLIFGGLAIASALLSSRRKELVEQQTSLQSIRELSWSAFESLVAEVYRRQGFAVDQSLKGGTDGGVDLVLRKDGQTTLVQCKQWRVLSVGAPTIREIFGVQTHEKADRSIVITSGHFTREARTFAEGKQMKLIDGEELLGLVREVQAKPQFTSTSVSPAIPSCPKCGASMIMRTAKRGANAGNSFWGCPTYPKCTGTRNA